MDDFSTFIALSRYARWKEKEQRRETWEETVDRYIEWFKKHLKTNPFNYKDDDLFEDLKKSILNLDVMPSMRALMTAGPALDKCHIGAYNCAYVAIDSQNKLSEILYILMCGTGVGFSVESQYVSQLPVIASEFYETDTTIVVSDSKIGWAKAFKELVGLLYVGQIPKWDLRKIRPAGARLKTFGGRASGSEPLDALFRFCTESFTKASGRKLTTLEVHDIVCKIADIVVVGGVRRSALLSLSDVADERLRTAKSGNWFNTNVERSLANNSACYLEQPDLVTFLREWSALYESRSGERGIFNRQSAGKVSPERRKKDFDFGTNPCSEIILRDQQFCNLSEVVIREKDSFDRIREKVVFATILGTLQSTLTNFKFISKEWKKNCEEEHLLGVSLTGIMDHPVMSGQESKEDLKEWLTTLKQTVIDTNREFAKRLGINESTATTCIKPSGTVSQLVNSSSGIHPRIADYYIRRVRNDVRDPISEFLRNAGVPCEQDKTNRQCIIFSFTRKAPAKTIIQRNILSLSQLELWKIYALFWCEHKPSCTIHIKEKEWLDVASWVYKNFDILSGISFFPFNDYSYEQMPEEGISKEEYEERVRNFPEIDWSKLQMYEKEDNVIIRNELQCSGGLCEI